jgi:hypothetical protein
VTDVVAQDRKLPNLKELWQMSTTFSFVTFAWIFFRADGMHFALGYIKQIGVSIIEHPEQFLLLPRGKMAFTYIIPLIIGDWYLRRDERILKTFSHKIVRITIYWILILLIFNSIGGEQSFIYFQF